MGGTSWLVVEENWRGDPSTGRVRASLGSGPEALRFAEHLTEIEDPDGVGFTIGTYADYARDGIRLVVQGIWLELRSGGARRPTSKKEVRDAVAGGPDWDTITVLVEATSLHGGEFAGPVDKYTGAKPIYFVGPDPYTSRKYYGSIVRSKDGRLTVK